MQGCTASSRGAGRGWNGWEPGGSWCAWRKQPACPSVTLEAMKRGTRGLPVGPTAALASGLTVLAILSVAIIFRKDIAVGWHLHWLESDGNYLPQLIEEPEGSAADTALRRWVETPRGKEAVFLILAEEAIGKWPATIDPNLEQAVFIVVADKGGVSGAYRPKEMSTGGGFSASVYGNVPRLRAIARHLPQLMGRDYAWERHPTFRFQIMDAELGFRLLGIDAAEFFGHALKDSEPACLVERLPER